MMAPTGILPQECTGELPVQYDTEDSFGRNQDVSDSIELRYKNEQALMDAISRGDYTSAREYLNTGNSYGMEQRLADTTRDKKNYLIIFNTLCRKAAQYGGVHPVYLDELSSRFAIQLETLYSVSRLEALPAENDLQIQPSGSEPLHTLLFSSDPEGRGSHLPESPG